MRESSVLQWPLGLDAKDLVSVRIAAIIARLDAVVSSAGLLNHISWNGRSSFISGLIATTAASFHILASWKMPQFASQTSIRQYLARQKKQVPLALKLRWVELFDAVRLTHSRSVLHGDISCNNIFLDDDLNMKPGDFAGSAIDDHPPLVCYQTSHELPDEDISRPIPFVGWVRRWRLLQ
jgi:serine/threonine protein kinase